MVIWRVFYVGAKKMKVFKIKLCNDWYYKVKINGCWKRVKGSSDKRATEAKAAQHQADIDRGVVGIKNQFERHNKTRLIQHIADYITVSTGKGNDSEYVYIVQSRLNKLISLGHWHCITDLTVENFLKIRDLKLASLAPKTRNEYQQLLRSFCGWLVKNGRMQINPFENLEYIKIKGDIRRQRRALSDDEISRLLAVVPAYRKACYLFAILTGLRRAEITQLKWDDVHLDSPQPFVNVRASTTKNGRQAIIFLRDDLVAELRQLPRETEYVFIVPQIQTFYRDLKSAGISAVDSLGRRADFHALRHTLATNLARSGVGIRTAMEVMRHSDIRLTTKTYTDAGMLATSEAIESLPRYQSSSHSVIDPGAFKTA